MRRLEAVTGDRLAYHAGLKPRIYGRQQWRRVRRSRKYVELALGMFPHCPTVLEIGCAALDISGRYAKDGAIVLGLECNAAYLPVVRARYPEANLRIGDVEKFPSGPVDILVACEILEHLVDPVSAMRHLMPQARVAVISHPFDEPDGIPDTEHYWSFTEQDFGNWFAQNNFMLLKSEVFRNGPFTIVIGLGKRNEG